MLGHVTPWSVPCGIAKHLSYWIGALARPQIIFAENPPTWQAAQEEWPTPACGATRAEVARCWRRGDPCGFDHIITLAEQRGVKFLLVQFDPTFFGHKAICALGDWAQETGVKLVFRFHIVHPSTAFTWQNKAALRVADRLIVGTPAMESALTAFADRFHIRLRAPIITIPLAAPPSLDLPALPARAKGPTVLTWGMLGGFKGHLPVYEAVKALRAGPYPAARYIIAGQAFTGEQRLNAERLVQMAAADPDALEVRLEFTSDQDLQKLLRSVDCIVLNHQAEHYSSSGTVALSVASCTPVVVSNSPMFSGYVERDLAIVSDGTAAGIAACIVRALRETDAIRSRAFGAASDYSPAAIAAANEKLFAELEGPR